MDQFHINNARQRFFGLILVGFYKNCLSTFKNEMTMYKYETVSQAINDLQKKGYTLNFNVVENGLFCSSNALQLSPEEFEIDAVYRYEGESDPGDESVVYAISSKVKNAKGILVMAYGAYADGLSTELIQKLNHHPEQI